MKLQAVGSDTELFAKRAGDVIPAYLFHHSEKGGGSPIHWDNAALEFAAPPSYDEDQFVRTMLEWRGRAESLITQADCIPDWSPSVVVLDDYLGDERIQFAGCSPDYNFYTRKRNKRVKFTDGTRSAGGHIHVSWEGAKTPVIFHRIGKAFEIMHGFVGVLHDTDKVRPSLYGRAGSFRPKDYGMELRSPSSWWLQSEKLIRFTWRCAQRAVEGENLFANMLGDAITQEVLNVRDTAFAYAYLDAHKLEIIEP